MVTGTRKKRMLISVKERREEKRREERTFGLDSTRSGAGILNGTAGVSWIPLLTMLRDSGQGYLSS